MGCVGKSTVILNLDIALKKNVQVSRGLKVHGMVFNSLGNVNIIVEGGSK